MPRNVWKRDPAAQPDRSECWQAPIGRDATRAGVGKRCGAVGLLQRLNAGSRKDFGEVQLSTCSRISVHCFQITRDANCVRIDGRSLASDRRVLCLQNSNGKRVEQVRNCQFGAAR